MEKFAQWAVVPRFRFPSRQTLEREMWNDPALVVGVESLVTLNPTVAVQVHVLSRNGV